MASKTPFDPRRARPGQAFSYIDGSGTEQTIKADAKGVLRPHSAAEVAVADSMALPIARSAKEPATPKKKPASRSRAKRSAAPRPAPAPAASEPDTSAESAPQED